ncbi:unnamed protein product [Ilex paraguariensis]|uniref:F-box domain-containing protein n=1 Tax=Ilex paraguariensis TaxID=185542 RepID=A0ABC8URN2_9AQUA
MGKKIRHVPRQVQNKDDHNFEDWISLLPDEVLILILSLLSVKEAAVTSILSRRWRYVWESITRLDFDAKEALVKIDRNHNDRDFLEIERRKYVNWVNQVVRLHKGQTIEEFRVSFDLGNSSKWDIDKWLKFVLTRRVYQLSLDLSMDADRRGIRHFEKPYTFSADILNEIKATSFENLSSKYSIMRHCSFMGFRCLKALCFRCVNVSGDVLECFLSDCPVLERLYVRSSPKLDDHNFEDWISLLPDEVLILILSLLSVKEAAVTSILSRRWRYVWESITRLDFDAKEALVKIDRNHNDRDFLEIERRKYVNWVNQVVRLHKGQTIEEFRVSFDLGNSSKWDIDKWLKFVLTRRVYQLSLDLSMDADRRGIRHFEKPYTFSADILNEIKATSFENLSSKYSIMRHCSFMGFRCLKALCFRCVNVSGDVLECFLSDCPVLERLYVRSSPKLVHFKVAGSGPPLVLKYLEICCCLNIKSMVISNVNLVALIYKGHKIRLLLENVPLLVELSISGLVSNSLNKFFPRLSCCLSQLQTLKLNAPMYEEFSGFLMSRELSSLKTFVLHSMALDDRCLLGYASLIKASPILKKFVLQVIFLLHIISLNFISTVYSSS